MMNYKNLEHLLLQAAETDDSDIWVSANDLTNEIILETLSEIRRSKGNFVNATSNSVDINEIIHFPCDTLRNIDSLWTEYSQEHFGFSVQQFIYGNCENLEKFYECVSWAYSDIKSPSCYPDLSVFAFGYPLNIAGPDCHWRCVLLDQHHQTIIQYREASIKAAKGNLPYCIKLVPDILLRVKACE